MALARQTFDHDSPSAPTRAAGMLLGSSGVTHPPLSTIGALSGTSSANGSFSDTEGYGHIDYDSSGYLYVFDSGNNRVQRFVHNATDGDFDYDSKLDGITTLVGGGSTNYGILAIDRTNAQIHLTLGDYTQTSGAWISVWNLSDWPNLTTLNRVRQYGSNSSSSDASGRSYLGLSLAIDDTYAVVSSALSPFRTLRWNHQTGVLENQETQATTYSQFATDGAGNWWVGAHAGAAEAGICKIDVTTLTIIGSRLDTASQTQWRSAQMPSTSAAPRPFYHGGRVYVVDYLGRISAWDAGTGAFVDDFVAPGSLGPSNTLTGANSGSHQLAATIYRDKGRVIVVGDKAYFVSWSHNASGTAAQCFLAVYPLATSTAAWTKTDWSAGTNTIKAISIKGTSLSGEKFKIRLRKNAGAWTTITPDLVQDEGTLDFETFTSGDTLTVELSLSTWDRLDGHATLFATRDKISPSEVAVQVVYEDTDGDVYVPYAAPGFRGKVGIQGAYKGKIGV